MRRMKPPPAEFYIDPPASSPSASALICEAVQFNLHSRAYRSGPYSPKHESGVRLFHTLMQHS